MPSGSPLLLSSAVGFRLPPAAAPAQPRGSDHACGVLGGAGLGETTSLDTEHFRPARNAVAEPADQFGLPSPRIGFFGVLDERLDGALLVNVGRLATYRSFNMDQVVGQALATYARIALRGPAAFETQAAN